MQIEPILSTGHLYSVKDVFPTAVVEQLNHTAWSTLDYTRLSIGSARRRQLVYNTHDCPAMFDCIEHTITPQIEHYCRVRFTDPQQSAITWWLDEPGFRPRMHTDGNKPSALQVYWHPDREDLGTAFYSSRNVNDLIHYFASRPNTGYLMFNTHQPRPELWHDMTKPVPVDVLRLCLYISFGPYVLTVKR
jgi:hypothetical protein